MFRKQMLIGLVSGIGLISLPAFSQEEEGLSRNEFTAQAFGSFVKSTTNNGVEQSASNSGGVLGTYRFLFNNYNGAEVDYGYSLNTQSYGLPGGSSGVKSYSHEFSAAYVFRSLIRRTRPASLRRPALHSFTGAGPILVLPDRITHRAEPSVGFGYRF
jgi:hypothetical protein